MAAHERGQSIRLQTSGSTGHARSVERTTASWVDSFPEVRALTRMDASSRLWLPGPLTSTMNLFASVLARFTGASLVADPIEATHAHLTPAALSRCVTEGRLATGTEVVVAGDRPSLGLLEAARAGGCRVSHYYGAAELSFVAWGSGPDDLRPFPGVEVTVTSGVIWARSPYLSTGYAGAPGPMRWNDAGFATVGDRGTLADGLLNVEGRGDDAIVTGGATVLVADVEAVLRSAARGDVVVVGLPHAELGAVVVAAVERADDVPHLRQAAAADLDRAQRPLRWCHVPSMPLTSSGKVDRLAVRQLLAEGSTPDLPAQEQGRQ